MANNIIVAIVAFLVLVGPLLFRDLFMVIWFWAGLAFAAFIYIYLFLDGRGYFTKHMIRKKDEDT